MRNMRDYDCLHNNYNYYYNLIPRIRALNHKCHAKTINQISRLLGERERAHLVVQLGRAVCIKFYGFMYVFIRYGAYICMHSGVYQVVRKGRGRLCADLRENRLDR